MSVRDQWLKVRPVIVTGRQNKTLLIPAFSANCGEAVNSLKLVPGGNATRSSTTFILLSTTKYTVECWIKPFHVPLIDTIILNKSDGGLGTQFAFQYIAVTNKIKATFINTGVTEYDISASSPLASNKWIHLALTLDTTNNIMNFYIDGKLVGTATTTGTFANTTSTLYFGSSNATTQFHGLIDDVRIWAIIRTATQISNSRFAPRGLPSNSIDVGLSKYWKFTSGITVDAIGGIDLAQTAGAVTIINTDQFPLKYGASFIAARYSVSLSGPSSLRFPIIPADDPNHCLCVSYLDEDNTTTIRKKLYSASEDYGIEDIAPNPPFYQGEVLPTNYYLEFWNIDGLPTVDLTADLTLKTSHTTYPNFGTDHAVSADATPIGTTALAATYPISFPMTFSSQQVYP